MKADESARVPESDRRLLALWAADCAERVLPLFEDRCLRDGRPRKAVATARAWARGESRVTEARAAASAAHCAARETEDAAARAAARAAGNAAATAHAAGHARAAAAYAVMAAAGAAGRPVAGLTAAGVRAGPVAPTAGAVVAREHDWQYGRLPEHLRELMASSLRLRAVKRRPTGHAAVPGAD
jgi:hypothetical protein